jgi:hypothetical protein
MTQNANPMPVHDNEREAAVQRMAHAVLAVRPVFHEDRNETAYWECPFCEEFRLDPGGSYEMKDIKHKSDCAYVIASSLVTVQEVNSAT